MNSNPIDVIRATFEQRRREGSARILPFLSFLLTHLALTAFLISSFLVHDFSVKIFVAALGVLLNASEWIYTILISNRWRRDIVGRLLAEADAQRSLEAAQRVTYEARIDQERQRWQGEITRRRWQRQVRQQGFQ
ncbi:MAG: hypothetical protein H0V70_23050 [Ktedonobacteraceae bacterium]|nr:hypothetical protein [Ktedonobacteraceae bacterium]